MIRLWLRDACIVRKNEWSEKTRRQWAIVSKYLFNVCYVRWSLRRCTHELFSKFDIFERKKTENGSVTLRDRKMKVHNLSAAAQWNCIIATRHIIDRMLMPPEMRYIPRKKTIFMQKWHKLKVIFIRNTDHQRHHRVIASVKVLATCLAFRVCIFGPVVANGHRTTAMELARARPLNVIFHNNKYAKW